GSVWRVLVSGAALVPWRGPLPSPSSEARSGASDASCVEPSPALCSCSADALEGNFFFSVRFRFFFCAFVSFGSFASSSTNSAPTSCDPVRDEDPAVTAAAAADEDAAAEVGCGSEAVARSLLLLAVPELPTGPPGPCNELASAADEAADPGTAGALAADAECPTDIDAEDGPETPVVACAFVDADTNEEDTAPCCDGSCADCCGPGTDAIANPHADGGEPGRGVASRDACDDSTEGA
ncbi:hypothetical protein Vafri_888, partial [Volvox africanus]